MIVLKFGGTSVGNATNIKKVAEIVNSYSEAENCSFVGGGRNNEYPCQHQ